MIAKEWWYMYKVWYSNVLVSSSSNLNVVDCINEVKCAMTYRTPCFSYLRRPYLPSWYSHLSMLSELDRIDDLIIVWTDVADHFLVLCVLSEQPLHFSCKEIILSLVIMPLIKILWISIPKSHYFNPNFSRLCMKRPFIQTYEENILS